MSDFEDFLWSWALAILAVLLLPVFVVRVTWMACRHYWLRYRRDEECGDWKAERYGYDFEQEFGDWHVPR